MAGEALGPARPATASLRRSTSTRASSSPNRRTAAASSTDAGASPPPSAISPPLGLERDDEESAMASVKDSGAQLQLVEEDLELSRLRYGKSHKPLELL
ncbi:hypothetical protein E2C01_042291 [Portunus trituberculatus]|uniref:Uncharacterized protein n=1 Tax=Portunus trituberculatus TaxID=210409 RepID=A0A5B7FT17_PORTR|nr:hypothetical protein [Portunus trituberculatus]